jgi:hypothetical protein
MHPVAELLNRLASELGDAATLSVQGDDDEGEATLTPTRSEAVTVEVSYGEGETWVELAGGGWPIEDEPDRLEAVLRAVVAGRVVEKYRLGRKAIEVTLADGSVDGSTGIDLPLGLIPQRKWRERAAVTQFVPYL